MSRDFALELGLPANPDAERFVLGSVLMDDAVFDQMSVLDAEDFSLEKHRRIFLRMIEIHARGERIDRVTVANELQQRGQLESVDGLSYIVSLDEGLPALVNLDGYVRIVSEKATLRRMVFASQALIDRCLREQDSPGELLADGERILRELGARSSNKGNLASAADVVAEMDLNELGRMPRDVIRTPYKALNDFIAGFYKGELIVIGARPSAGKTVMAIEMAMSAAENGSPVAFFSLEMRKQAVLTRAACNRGNVDANRLRFGKLTQVERMDFSRALSSIADLPWYIDDRAPTFAGMSKEVRRMPKKPRLVVIDHLHLMRGNARAENRNNELAQITRELKLFAGEMACTVLLLSQLNRASDKENRPPEMRDLRECGAIESDADVILFLHRKQEVTTEVDNKGKPVPVDLRIAKQRDGQTFIRLPMMLVGPQYRFVDAAKQSAAEGHE